MQPNDPRQQTPGYPAPQPGQSQPYQQQPGVVQNQPPVYAQQPPSYNPAAQPNPYGQPPQYSAPQQPYLSPLEPSAQQFQPLPPRPEKPGTGKRILVVSLVVLIVLALGVGGYLFATKSNNTKTPSTSTSKTNSNKTPKTPKTTGNFQSLGNFTLAAPTGDALKGMTSSPATAADTYATLTNSDNSCTIGFGVLSQAALPGTDLHSLVAIKIAEAKKQDTHITATGPNDADSLVLKDTTGKTYALPTASFILTDTTTGGGTINELYSAAELADKSHVVVYASCNSDKPNDTSLAAKVNALLPVMQAITVQPQK